MAVKVQGIPSYQLACLPCANNHNVMYFSYTEVLKLIDHLYAPKQRHNINAFQEQLVRQY